MYETLGFDFKFDYPHRLKWVLTSHSAYFRLYNQRQLVFEGAVRVLPGILKYIIDLHYFFCVNACMLSILWNIVDTSHLRQHFQTIIQFALKIDGCQLQKIKNCGKDVWPNWNFISMKIFIEDRTKRPFTTRPFRSGA